MPNAKSLLPAMRPRFQLRTPYEPRHRADRPIDWPAHHAGHAAAHYPRAAGDLPRHRKDTA